MDPIIENINPLHCFSISSVEHILIEQYEKFYGEYIGFNLTYTKLEELLLIIRATTESGTKSPSGKPDILTHESLVYEIQNLEIWGSERNHLIKIKFLILWMIWDQSMLWNPLKLKRSGNFLDLQYCLDFSLSWHL